MPRFHPMLLLLTGRPGIADGRGRYRRGGLPARSRRRRRAGPAHRPGAATGVAHGPAMDRPWTGRSRRPDGGGPDAQERRMMTLDADAERLIEMARNANAPSYDTVDAATARKLYRDGRRVLAPEPVPVAETRDLSAPGPHGPIPLRLYRPNGATVGDALPVLVYFHGGG